MQKEITAVIIDDQLEAQEDLLYILKSSEAPVKVVDVANSGKDGLVAILKHKPQLIFLDVNMPGMSGFEMLELLPNLNFHLIITTSDNQHAIQAIRSSALDFLLKPIKVKELRDAVERAINKKDELSIAQIHMLEESLKKKNSKLSKIALTIAEGVELVNTDDILYFESDGNYTMVHLRNGKQTLITKPIGKFEELVEHSGFFRVHNSFLINLFRVTKFIRSDGGYVVLDNGKSISVARNRKDAFLEALSKI